MSFNQAREDLAAAFRLAARENLHEGIDGHFSFDLGDDTFLINRWGVHWSQLRKTDVLRVDRQGRVLDGEGEVETTALQIHAAFHRQRPKAKTVMHTHMPYASALACVDGEILPPISQQAVMFYGNIAFERNYNGLAEDEAEGNRLASALGDKSVLFLANHGVIVTGPTIGITFHDLYFLERAAKIQFLAHNSGLPPILIPAEIAKQTHDRITRLSEDKETCFAVMKQTLQNTASDCLEYRQR